MKTLILLRHAKSSWKDETLPDHERPLNKRGKRTAPLAGEELRRRGALPDLILCSTARRARQTAELVIKASGYGGEVRYLETLYATPPAAHLEALRTLEDVHSRVMVIGHNPALEELLHLLTDEVHPLPTAAIAMVELPLEHWEELDPSAPPQGRLTFWWRPEKEE